LPDKRNRRRDASIVTGSARNYAVQVLKLTA